MDTHGEDLDAVRDSFDAWCDEVIAPWVRDHVDMDTARLARWAGADIDLEPAAALRPGHRRRQRRTPASAGSLRPYLSMTAGPDSLDPLQAPAARVYETGWRPAYADGPTRDELARIVSSAVPRGHDAGVSMPHRLGRYAVRRRIGSGGFATVWLAYDEQLDSPVAIKVLADNWTEDHQIRQRFLEEGRYLRKVESPHVVSVYDAGELDDGRPYLVMSYADQGTLADRLEVEGLTPAQAMEVVRQVGAGLQALHDRDILHRDIKPANVLFRSVEGADGHDGPRDGRRPRAGQGAGHVLAAHDDRRHPDLRRPRAGRGRRRPTRGPTSTPSPPWPSCCSPAGRRSPTPRCPTR